MNERDNDQRYSTPYSQQALDRNSRLISGRGFGLLARRPDPPRGLSLDDAVLSWEEPKERSNISHYIVYSNGERTVSGKVPVGQATLQLPSFIGQLFVSSFNDKSGLESIRVPVLSISSSIISDVVSTVKEQTLTANTAITHSTPASDGDLLFVLLTQNGTGGWTITWSAVFDTNTTTDIDSVANALTVVCFVGKSNLWKQFNPAFLRN